MKVLYLAALGLLVVACGEDAKAPQHERVATLEEVPLALLAHGDTVFVAGQAELVKIDDASRSQTRLTDGRYRECPWDPWHKWEWPLAVTPTLTPDGSALLLTAHLCGTWAWPLEGGDVVSIARANKDYRAVKTDSAPLWDAVTTVPAVRDGDGWIACGKQDADHSATSNEIWSLAADGSPRELLAGLDGYECTWLAVDKDAIYAATTESFGRFDRATRSWKTLAKPNVSFGKLTIAGATSTHFVILHDRRIDRLPKDGGPAETIVTEEGSSGNCGYGCFTAAVDEDYVYWTDGRVLSRTPNVDITQRQEILPADETRVFPFPNSRLPSMALTTNAIWITTSEGPSARERKPFLARVPKPLY